MDVGSTQNASRSKCIEKITLTKQQNAGYTYPIILRRLERMSMKDLGEQIGAEACLVGKIVESD